VRVFVTGGTGHTGSYIIPELIAAGHEVAGLARSDTAAAAVSALGAKVRRGDLEDLDGLMEAAADSDGVIHVAHRQDLLPFGGMDAVSAAELPVMLAYGEALAEPLVHPPDGRVRWRWRRTSSARAAADVTRDARWPLRRGRFQ
jgi:saccharopine dehydrogenase-like NADP-dependent oxidoreductase